MWPFDPILLDEYIKVLIIIGIVNLETEMKKYEEAVWSLEHHEHFF